MAATTGQLFSTHSNRIEEVINKDVDVIMPGLDPCWMDTIVTSQGVGPADQIGRDMQIIKVFQTGMTGVVEQNGPQGNWALFGNDGDTPFGKRLHTMALTRAFPDPQEGANQTPFRLGVPMRAMLANIMFTLGELQAEATPAFIGQVVAPKLEGFARHIAHQLCTSWYVSQNQSYRLCAVSNLDVTAGVANGVFNFNFQPDNEACDRFYPGMRIDFYDGNTRNNETGNNRIPVFVSAVDELTNTVYCVTQYDPTAGSTAGTVGNFGAAVANADIVVWANSGEPNTGATGTPSFTGIAGINSWLKDGSDGTLTGTPSAGAGDELKLLGSEATSDFVSIADHPEMKSLGYNLGGAMLTEHVLRQLCRRFHAAKNKYGYYMDTLIASEGVWLAYEASKIGRERIDRTNTLGGASPQGYNSDSSFGGFKITMDGKTYMSYTSTYVDDGIVYGIRKGGNNWKRYVPPDVRNTRPFDRNAPFIPFKFVASALTGLSTNQLPIFQSNVAGGNFTPPSGSSILSSTRVTEGSQMPGWLRMQLVPDQPCGMILKNCATDKIYGDF